MIDSDTLYKTIRAIDCSYDEEQNIFYYNADSWQRRCGYCSLYDEAAITLGMIIECEPICFEYGGKMWLIEFWKGQYGIAAGAEIGIYTPAELEICINGFYKCTFYNCAADEDQLEMSCILKKRGKELFKRESRQWWLTGFKPGEFSDPSELTLSLSITLKDNIMCSAFMEGLKRAGYLEEEIVRIGNTASFEFNKPRSPQPIIQTALMSILTQVKNELLCGEYQYITNPYDNLLDKVNALEKERPQLLKELFKIGKTDKVFELYKTIEKYIY